MADNIDISTANKRRDILRAGSGGGTFEIMEARVKSLEGDMKTLLQDTAEIKGMLRTAPSAVDFGELKGRVNALPTTAKVASIAGIVGIAMTVALRWDELMALLSHR